MLDHYLKLLKSDIDPAYNGPAGYSYFNKTIAKWDDIEDVTQLEFRYFYQSMIVDLYKRGEINLVSDEYLISYMSDVESFLENADRLMEQDYDLYNDQKIYSQRFYGELLRQSPNQIKNLTNLVHLIFDDIVKNNTNIIEIDTYLIYYTGELDLSWIPARSRTEKFKYFFPLSKKRSILINSKNEIKVRGNLMESEERLVMPFVKSKIRDCKIDDIIG